MTNSYNIHKYNKLKKRLEKIEEKLDSDLFIPECMFNTLEKEKENIRKELTQMEKEGLIWKISL